VSPCSVPPQQCEIGVLPPTLCDGSCEHEEGKRKWEGAGHAASCSRHHLCISASLQLYPFLAFALPVRLPFPPIDNVQSSLPLTVQSRLPVSAVLAGSHVASLLLGTPRSLWAYATSVPISSCSTLISPAFPPRILPPLHESVMLTGHSHNSHLPHLPAFSANVFVSAAHTSLFPPTGLPR
jgi:hypothetical protein